MENKDYEMKNDEILLNEIYQNSITAVLLISGILKKIESQSMFDFLFDKMTEYREIEKTAYDMLLQINCTPKNSDYHSQLASLLTIGKPSTNRLAKVLLSGSKEGFFSLVDSVNTCANAKKETRQLAYKLLSVEDENIKNMKFFLNE